MKIPVITGTIRRRLLLNFRVDADVLRGVLPTPFRPKFHNGVGIAGVCLIRLEGIRLKASPLPLGISSDNDDKHYYGKSSSGECASPRAVS